MTRYSARFYLTLAVLFAMILPGIVYGYEIEIIGSAEFKQQVTRALARVSEKAPDAYQMITDYVGRIEYNERSGMLAYETPPTYQLSSVTAFYSVSWCASTIAHDAYHSKLYHEYRKKHGEPVSYDAWAGFEAEKKCIAFQLEVLKKIEAPLDEITYCISLDGTHGDVNKDGKLDSEDYDLRSW